MLVGDGSQSTDQPSGKAQGQGKGRVGSSQISLKNIQLARLSILILSKAYPSHGILRWCLDPRANGKRANGKIFAAVTSDVWTLIRSIKYSLIKKLIT
jgi:hypothetical protein